MNVLVTGASGGLGRHLMPLLAQEPGIHLRALAHRQPVDYPGVETVSGDLNDASSLRSALEKIDCLFHLAALTHTSRSAEYHRINVEGTQNLLEAGTQAGIRRVVYVSSLAAHPEGGAYSQSKLAAEKAIQQSGWDWVILRPAEVYGPGSPDAINQLIGWIRQWPVIPVIGDGAYRLSPVHIDDVLPAMKQALLETRLNGKTLILAGPEAISFNELVARLSAYLNLRRQTFHIPVSLAKALARWMSWLGLGALMPDQIPRLLCEKDQNIQETSRLLHYQPCRLEDGLKKILEV